MRIKATDPEGINYNAYLDEELVEFCIEADDEGGWVREAELSEDGFAVTDDDGNVKITKKYGEVRLEKVDA